MENNLLIGSCGTENDLHVRRVRQRDPNRLRERHKKGSSKTRLRNELIQNAVDHSFRQTAEGAVHVTVEEREGDRALWVSNGGEQCGPYLVEGIGYDFFPDVLDRSCVDEWVKTNDRVSFELARRLIREEGMLVGGSSGSVMQAAFEVAAREVSKVSEDQRDRGTEERFDARGIAHRSSLSPQNPTPNAQHPLHIVVILADNVRNYLSKFINEEWMKEKGME